MAITARPSFRPTRGATRRSVLLSGGALAALAASGRGALAQAEQPVPGDILTLGFSSDPAGFDPARGPSGMSHVVIEQVYSTLMALDADANPYPELAESFEVSADGLEYRFRLRPGVTFHNGDALTADDVKFTFDRLRAPDSGYAYASQVANIADVIVDDPLTVRFTLSAETGPFLTYMAFPGSSIVPKALVEGGHDLNAHPIGSGPFRFVSYQPRSSIVLDRNPTFFEPGKPYFDGVEFRIIADETALTNALLAGTVQFSNEVPPKDWATVAADSDLVTEALEGSRYFWLVPNNARPPFDNPLIRQAIAHAIDRDAIVRGAFFGQATAIRGGVIPSWSWAYAGLDTFAPRSNPERARALLAAAGLPNGFDTTLTMPLPFPSMVAMAPIIQANLAAVGIRAEIRTMEVPRFWDEVWAPSNFDLTAMFWISPLADPDDFVFNNYACRTPINVQQSCSAAMDELLQRAKSATDVAARRALYAAQQQLSLVEMPIVPLVNASILTAHVDELRGFHSMRTGFLKSLKDSWLAV